MKELAGFHLSRVAETFDPSGNRTNPKFLTGPNIEPLSIGGFQYTFEANDNQIGKVNIAISETWTFGHANPMTGAVREGRGEKLGWTNSPK